MDHTVTTSRRCADCGGPLDHNPPRTHTPLCLDCGTRRMLACIAVHKMRKAWRQDVRERARRAMVLARYLVSGE